MRGRIFTGVVIVGALLGFAFAAFSTYDFVAHLDRQVHGLHCSFFPGLAEAESGTGCAVTLMSPYSSVMRDSVWGGIPISLPAMAVFAFIAAFAAWVIVKRRESDARATAFLLASTGVPVLASIVMGYISFSELDAACKLCIGIYAASGIAFAGALALYLTARKSEPAETFTWGGLATAFGAGVAFVVLAVGAYAGAAPDFERYVGACGELAQPDDPHGVLVPLGPQGHGVQMVEVLDPLCPSCKAFEGRYTDLEASAETRRRVLLFPLDDQCNWMVDHAIHPGACAVSEAILCAGDDAEEVVQWAFEEQEQILAAAESDPEAAGRMAKQRFPQHRDCIGSPAVRARLNLGLRWAVDNQLPLLTPQIYVGGTRLCDEDTDIGLDFALTRLIERTPATAAPPPPPERPAPSAAVASTGNVAAPGAPEAVVAPQPEDGTGETDTEPAPDTAADTDVAPAAATGAATGAPPEPAPAAGGGTTAPAGAAPRPAPAGTPTPAPSAPAPTPPPPAATAPSPTTPTPTAPAPSAPAPTEPEVTQ